MVTLLLKLLVIVHTVVALFGGQEARPGQFPYQILLKRYHAFVCGGSIVSSNYVLTAAHCVASSGAKPYPAEVLLVVAGLGRSHEEQVTCKVSRVIVNQNFRNVMNDIALLQLERPLVFTAHVCAIELDPVELPTGSKVIVAGFGGSESPVPAWSSFVSLSDQECAKASGIDFKGFLCLGHSPSNGVCNGDSGGPAVYRNKLVGVTNSIINRCASNFPVVFAKVSYYIDWIRENSDVLV